MKQQNFLFVDIVSSIFLLVILIGNFLGLLYITEGNVSLSILGSLFLVVCYFFVVVLLKTNKEAMIKNNFLHGSFLFWIFFLLLGYVSFILMSHFINIEFNCKAPVKSEASRKIEIVDSISMVYKKRAKNDLQDFEAQLKTCLNSYKNKGNKSLRDSLILAPFKVDPGVLNNPAYINVGGVADAVVAPIQIKVDNNIKNIDSTIFLNSKKYLSVFENWKRLSLMSTYSKLNDYVEDNIKMINFKIGELPLDKTLINVSFNKEQLPLNNPKKLNQTYPPNYLLPIIVVIITHLFILIPFFSHKVRGYKSTGPNKKSKNGKSKRFGTIEL